MVEKRWFFGRKLHLLTNAGSVLLRFRITSGNLFDSRKFHSLVQPKNKRITGDPAYRAKKPKAGRLFITKPFAKERHLRKRNGKRTGIERVFGALKDLGLEKGVVVKCARSLGTHILAVLACFLSVQYLNLKEGLSPLAYGRFLM